MKNYNSLSEWRKENTSEYHKAYSLNKLDEICELMGWDKIKRNNKTKWNDDLEELEKNYVKKINELNEKVIIELDKFYISNNKAAGTRARIILKRIENVTKDYRKEFFLLRK